MDADVCKQKGNYKKLCLPFWIEHVPLFGQKLHECVWWISCPLATEKLDSTERATEDFGHSVHLDDEPFL